MAVIGCDKTSGKDDLISISLVNSYTGIPDWFWKKIEHPDGACRMQTSGKVLMPWRQAVIDPDIPLYCVPHSVRSGGYRYGEELEQIIVSRTSCRFCTSNFRTKPFKRELTGKHPPKDAPETKKRGKRGERK